MGKDNIIFLENIEWFDETGNELVHRIPEHGSGEIKFGAQLTVSESQAAVFFYQGKAIEAYGPGRHTLITANIPLLTKILSIPWALDSPLRAEVYLVNMKVFPVTYLMRNNSESFRHRVFFKKRIVQNNSLRAAKPRKVSICMCRAPARIHNKHITYFYSRSACQANNLIP